MTLHPIFADLMSPYTYNMSPGLQPPAPRVHLCDCGEPLTMEMEFDGDVAKRIDCRRDEVSHD